MRIHIVALLLLLPLASAGQTIETGHTLPGHRGGGTGITFDGALYAMGRTVDGAFDRGDEIWRYDPDTGQTTILDTHLPGLGKSPALVDGRVWYPWTGTCGIAGVNQYGCTRVSAIDLATDTIEEITAGPETGLEGTSSKQKAAWWPGPSTNCPDGCLYIFSHARVLVLAAGHTSGRTISDSAIPAEAGLFVTSEGIYLFGGGLASGTSDAVLFFDPSTETFNDVDSTLPEPLYPEAITFHDGKVLLVGARDPYGGAKDKVYVFDPATYGWEVLPWRLPSGATSPYAAVLGDTLYIIGGYYTDKIWKRSLLNDAPTVTASASPTQTQTNQAITFGTTANDPDGTLTATHWSFGDGATASTASTSHAYTTAGTYTATVTVTDNEGATASDSVQITVRNPPDPNQPNRAPVAAFSASPGVLSASFTSTATDPDGDPLTHAWSFGDGATSTETNPTHDYAAAGTYNVKLVVNDGEYTAETTQTVTVTAPTAPVAAFTLSSQTAVEGTTITATSTTIEGSGTHTYTWFLDGAKHASGGSASFNAGVGSHSVKLVVGNEYHQSSEAVKSFTVTAKPVTPTPTPTPVPSPTTTPTLSPTPTEAPHAADKESPAGFFLIPALLAVAWISRRR